MEYARNYTMDRKQFKRPLAANQLIQFKLAEQMADINLGLQAVLRATRLKEGIQSTCLEVRSRRSVSFLVWQPVSSLELSV